MEVEFLELLLRVDVHVPGHDDGARVQGHLGVGGLHVIRGDRGRSPLVAQLHVQDGRRGPRGRALRLAHIVEAEQQRQKYSAADEHAAGAASEDLVHGPRAMLDSRGVSFGRDSPGATVQVAGSRVDDHCRRSLPDSGAVVRRLHGTRGRWYDLEIRELR